MRGFLNPAVRRDAHFRGPFTDDDYREVHTYYAAHPELPPTPLRSLPALAAKLGLGSVSAKDETQRFGLNAFKVAGVRYAVHRLGDARAALGLVCATTGNHGRAVARVAHAKGVPCTVFVPALTSESTDSIYDEARRRTARIAAMKADRATVVEVDGSYEDAVRRAAAHGEATGATIVSDTSWPGYEQIPLWIMAGYTQIFEEAYSQWDRAPHAVIVQGGVGGLVCAAASWCAWRFGATRPFVIACEPDGAACLLESARAAAPVTIPGPLRTIMAGLRCAEPSPAAWPAIAGGVDAFVSVPDARALEAMAGLAAADGDDPPIIAGPSGACGAAALLALAQAPELAKIRSAGRLDRSTHALIVVTEGP